MNKDLTVGKPSTVLWKFCLPMFGSIVFQQLYNIADSLVAGKFVGEAALAAVGNSYEITLIFIAFAFGCNIGCSVIVSRFFGARQYEDMKTAVTTSLIGCAVLTALLMAVGLTGCDALLRLINTPAEIMADSALYLDIYVLGLPFMFFYNVATGIFSALGDSKTPFLFLAASSISNIFMDIFFVTAFQMGVAGAAAATVAGQMVAMLLGIYFNLKNNHEITFKFKGFRPDASTIKRIYAVGVPSIVMASISSVMTFGVNKILMSFTSTATAVFGVYFKLQSFIFMPVFGLNNGMVPIISYNYGARHRDRMVHTIKLSIFYAVCIMLVGFAIFQIVPQVLLGFFNASQDMLVIGVPALRIISLSFLFAGFCIIVGSVFQALGNGILSLIVSVARQLVVLLPVAFLMSLTGNLDAVWFSFPISEIASVVLSALFMRHTYKKIIAPLGHDGVK